MDSYDISVVITYYKKGKLLMRALASVRDQLLPGDEVIIVDDGSGAEADALFAELSAQGAYRIFRFTENLGAARAKNAAVGYAACGLIVLLDADDELPCGALEAIRSAFRANPDTDICCGDYIVREGEQETRVSLRDLTVDGVICPRRALRSWRILGSSPFRRAAFDRLGGYDPLYPRTDDVDFHRRAFVSGMRFTYIPQVIYVWRREGAGNSCGIPDHVRAWSFFRSIEFFFRFRESTFRFLVHVSKNLVAVLRLAGRAGSSCAQER